LTDNEEQFICNDAHNIGSQHDSGTQQEALKVM
jgi:hypothetical protein